MSIDKDLFSEVLDELRLSFNLPKAELERIINSEFRVIRNSMSNREGKVIQLIYLGKFRPTIYNKDYVKARINTERLEKCSMGESKNREVS